MKWKDISFEGKYIYYHPSFIENGKVFNEWCQIVNVVQFDNGEFGIQFPDSTQGVYNILNETDEEMSLFYLENV